LREIEFPVEVRASVIALGVDIEKQGAVVVALVVHGLAPGERGGQVEVAEMTVELRLQRIVVRREAIPEEGRGGGLSVEYVQRLAGRSTADRGDIRVQVILRRRVHAVE